jgi:ABC-type uncharacterized transport system substrate-binding protein
MKRFAMLMMTLLLLAGSTTAFAENLAGKKILFVNSYHAGYPWSDGVVAGAKEAVKGSGVELKVVEMDTKRNGTEEFAKQAALKVKAEIERWKPDVVIVSDDAASKYLVMPYYKNASLPFVFCGVNWDSTVYGYPYKNATGMDEVALIQQIIRNLKDYAKGSRIGSLTTDDLTERKEVDAYKKIVKVDFAVEKYVKTFAQWKEAYKAMQGQVDMIIIGNKAAIPDFKDAEAAEWVLANSKVPTGTINDWMMPVTMLGITKVPEEQGIWAVNAALKILAGTPPSSIPVAKNVQGNLLLNVKLATKAGITFNPALVKNAKIVN